MAGIRKVIRRLSPPGQVTTRIEHRVRAAGDRLFRAEDATARRHGWRIEVRRAGLARQYRDPRFDTLAACSHCRGTGCKDAQDCPSCAGTGRIVLGLPRRCSQEGRIR
jgi:RecJ-like exonuclease